MNNPIIAHLFYSSIVATVETIVDSGARVFGCQISMNMMDLTIEDFVDVAEVLCAMEMLKSANGAQVVFV